MTLRYLCIGERYSFFHLPSRLLDVGPQADARTPVSGASETYTASSDLRRVRTGSLGTQERSHFVFFVSDPGVSVIVVRSPGRRRP